ARWPRLVARPAGAPTARASRWVQRPPQIWSEAAPRPSQSPKRSESARTKTSAPARGCGQTPSCSCSGPRACVRADSDCPTHTTLARAGAPVISVVHRRHDGVHRRSIGGCDRRTHQARCGVWTQVTCYGRSARHSGSASGNLPCMPGCRGRRSTASNPGQAPTPSSAPSSQFSPRRAISSSSSTSSAGRCASTSSTTNYGIRHGVGFRLISRCFRSAIRVTDGGVGAELPGRPESRMFRDTALLAATRTTGTTRGTQTDAGTTPPEDAPPEDAPPEDAT
ncbi:MAG: hypothetical protein JWO57_542, partial [Pseudonocardiales bacterium]|nr:hypothetical protein [Pseudonocardiales bacterium]